MCGILAGGRGRAAYDGDWVRHAGTSPAPSDALVVAVLALVVAVAAPLELGSTPVRMTSVRYCYEGAAGVHLTNETVERVTFEAGEAR